MGMPGAIEILAQRIIEVAGLLAEDHRQERTPTERDGREDDEDDAGEPAGPGCHGVPPNMLLCHMHVDSTICHCGTSRRAAWVTFGP